MVHVVCFNVALVMVLWVTSLHDDDVDEDDGDDYDVDDPIGTGVEGKVAVLPSVGTRLGDLLFSRALGVPTWAVLAVFALFACIESSLPVSAVDGRVREALMVHVACFNAVLVVVLWVAIRYFK